MKSADLRPGWIVRVNESQQFPSGMHSLFVFPSVYVGVMVQTTCNGFICSVFLFNEYDELCA